MVAVTEPSALAPGQISLGSVEPHSLIDQFRFEEVFMKVSMSRNVVGFALLVLVMILTVSYEAMGHGRGRGRRNSQMDRKCAKFVNCHDARDGRLDGRGPDRDDSITDRIFRRSRRNRDRDRDGDRDRTTRRRRHRDRDFDLSRGGR